MDMAIANDLPFASPLRHAREYYDYENEDGEYHYEYEYKSDQAKARPIN